MAIRRTVLVVAQDTVVAALVGLLLEGAGFDPAFAAAGESPEDALTRLRPLYALLLDGGDAQYRSDLLLGRAERIGVRVAVFSASHLPTAVEEWAAHRGIPVIAFPTTADRLQVLLEESDRSSRNRRIGERRTAVAERQPEDEPFMWADSQGRSWRVFDRRGAERREPTDRRAGFRTFVRDDERRECAMSEADFVERSTEALARQFARALPLR